MSQHSNERLTYSIAEACALLGVSRPTLNAAISNGDIPVVRIGKRLFVPRMALEKRLAEQSVQAAAEAMKPDAMAAD